ncbi:MAG: ATP-binding cassette domain-containing protein [Alphaproteobacteria bacterium]|nr:ATP-binding cassette domain-containing protein [Alphaproteobacteria bacterium]
MTGDALLSVRDLSVRFETPDGTVNAVNGIGLDVAPGECVGIVGESGSGKSQTFLALMGLIASNGTVTGSARFQGTELVGLPPRRLNQIRGAKMAMIFQDPMTSLTPHMRVCQQLSEVLVRHRGLSHDEARAKALAALDQVRIPDAKNRLDQYPHEFSGGMRQRVMIAIALLCEPALLIADEPTTALDVTVQAQILDLLGDLRRRMGMAIILITHDLGIVAGLCDRVNVMYAGAFCETAPVGPLFRAPQHPYTRGLLSSVPRPDQRGGALTAIAGQPPNLQMLPPGCPFAPRCAYRFDRCDTERPLLREAGAPAHLKSCHLGGFTESGAVLP